MQEVTCFHCGNAVRISPDKSLCSECGEDLQHLLAPEYVAAYFYERAQELANQGEVTAALAQVERGLTYAAGAELHLLAAILAQQVERYDQMRHHVAAIAVDDTLRPEAEWLLRAHQARQRALRGQAAPAKQAAGAATLLDDLLGRSQGAKPATGPRPLQALWPALAVMALLGLVALAYMTWGADRRIPQTAVRPDEPALTPVPAPVETPPAETGDETADETPQVDGASVEFDLLPTPTPTSELPSDIVPENVVQVADAATADNSPRPVVIIAANVFDLAQYLRDNGYPHLTELGVDARLQGTTLILRGIVHLDLQRRQLVEAVSAAPGVSEVNTVDLMLLPAPVYVVQEGETLWSIVYDIYGNADRMQDLIDLNRDVMPSPELLSPGTELKIPPVQ